MRVVEFPYTLYKGMPAPIIPVQLKHKSEWYDLWAFVDSGAAYSIFSAQDAKGMGLDLSKALKRMVIVGDGSFIPVFYIKMPMRIGEVELQAEVGFSAKLGV